MDKSVRLFIIISMLLFSVVVRAHGNISLDSNSEAKHLIYNVVYREHRFTVYCGATFDTNRYVTLPEVFIIPEYHDRAYRAETEHIVTAENLVGPSSNCKKVPLNASIAGTSASRAENAQAPIGNFASWSPICATSPRRLGL